MTDGKADTGDVVMDGQSDAGERLSDVGGAVDATDIQTAETGGVGMDEQTDAVGTDMDCQPDAGVDDMDAQTDTSGDDIDGQSDSAANNNINRRVKVYVLNADRNWDDKGTGHVTFDALRPALIVHSETQEDNGKILLNSDILLSTGYQKQQETLIVWAESDTCDLALSFQAKAGCDEIWSKICEVQGKDPNIEHTLQLEAYADEDDENTDLSNISHGQIITGGTPVQLPLPDAATVGDISELLTNSMHLASRREALANAIEQSNYIAKLLELFKQLEELQNMNALRTMYAIFKNLFMLNKNSLLEQLLGDENIKHVVGVLEYDPTLATPGEKRQHRDYLWHEARYKQVCAITSPQLLRKIHQIYRSQYIQDVILPAPSILEENLLSALNSFIFFQRVDIVNSIIEDYELLREFFDKLISSETSPQERYDASMFLKELCTFAQTLQNHGPSSNKEQFFKTLVSLGVLPALERCLAAGERYATRAAAMEIMAMLVDHNAQLARDYMYQQSKQPWALGGEGEQRLLINLLVAQLWTDEDVELACGLQLITVLRLLVDPENIMSTMATRTEKAEFSAFFYKQSMPHLCAPLIENTAKEDAPVRDDYAFAVAEQALCDFIMYCCEHHSYHARNLITNKRLLQRILSLLKSTHAFLKLTALRVFRRIVGLKDEYFNKHIIRHELIVPIFECYRRNGHTYNLLNSALLELFEFIRTENIRSLLLHVGKYAYEQPLGDIAYVDTFKQLRTRFEQFTEAATASGGTVTTGHVATRAHTPDWKQREDEWFNEDDEEWADDLPHVNVQQEQKRLRTVADSIFHHQSGGAGMYSSTSAKRRDSMQLMAPGTEPKRPAVATMDDNDENTIVLTREEQEEEDQAIARVERLPSMAAVRRQRDEDDGVDMFSRTGRKLAERGAHTSRSGRISIRPFVHQPNAVDSESYSTPCMSTTATSTLNERAQFVDNDGSDTSSLSPAHDSSDPTSPIPLTAAVVARAPLISTARSGIVGVAGNVATTKLSTTNAPHQLRGLVDYEGSSSSSSDEESERADAAAATPAQHRAEVAPLLRRQLTISAATTTTLSSDRSTSTAPIVLARATHMGVSGVVEEVTSTTETCEYDDDLPPRPDDDAISVDAVMTLSRLPHEHDIAAKPAVKRLRLSASDDTRKSAGGGGTDQGRDAGGDE